MANPHIRTLFSLHTLGRWTPGEHKLFLDGLKLYDKQWKSIAEMIKTRTVVQVRTHAQKYFAKQKKRQPDMSYDSMSYSMGGSLSHSSLSSSSSLGSLDVSDGYNPLLHGGSMMQMQRRYKKGPGGNKTKGGLSVSTSGTRLHRSGSMESTTTSEHSLTPRIRKRTAAHQTDFFYEDHTSEGPYTSDDADTISTSETRTSKRRATPRASNGVGAAGALFDPSATTAVGAVDLAFDADFRADIIASELSIDGMGGIDKLVFGTSQRPVSGGDDETSVDNFSPMSHTESSSTHEEDLFMCANEALYPDADSFADLDTFIMSGM